MKLQVFLDVMMQLTAAIQPFHSEHLFEDFFQAGGVDGFGNDLIDFAGPGPLDVFLFDVASDCHDHWLRDLVSAVEISDLLCGLEAIHHGHANVCQNQSVDVFALQQVVFDLIESLQSVVGPINLLGQAFDFQLVHNNLDSQNVEWLIVDDQDSLFLRDFCD